MVLWPQQVRGLAPQPLLRRLLADVGGGALPQDLGGAQRAGEQQVPADGELEPGTVEDLGWGKWRGVAEEAAAPWPSTRPKPSHSAMTQSWSGAVHARRMSSTTARSAPGSGPRPCRSMVVVRLVERVPLIACRCISVRPVARQTAAHVVWSSDSSCQTGCSTRAQASYPPGTTAVTGVPLSSPHSARAHRGVCATVRRGGHLPQVRR